MQNLRRFMNLLKSRDAHGPCVQTPKSARKAEWHEPQRMCSSIGLDLHVTSSARKDESATWRKRDNEGETHDRRNRRPRQ
jgi:hypothetical protein